MPFENYAKRKQKEEEYSRPHALKKKKIKERNQNYPREFDDLDGRELTRLIRIVNKSLRFQIDANWYKKQYESERLRIRLSPLLSFHDLRTYLQRNKKMHCLKCGFFHKPRKVATCPQPIS